MHSSVLAYLARILTPSDVLGKEVLEVGSLNVNGSPRSVLAALSPARYVGVDARGGPGVDMILDAGDLPETFGEDAFDLVLSTEMLEHCADWRLAVLAMKKVLRIGGLLVLTTRGPGFPRHDHPGDYWRFTEDNCARIFSDMDVRGIEADTECSGVFVAATKVRETGMADLLGVEPAGVP